MNKLLLLASLAALSINVYAGDKGNGGGSHYCTYADGSFKSIETFDLYEGRDRYNLIIPGWDGQETKEQILERTVLKLSIARPGFGQLVKMMLENLQRPELITSKQNKKLRIVTDAHQWYVDEGCEYRQIVNWIEKKDGTTERILRDQTNYERMDPLNQAALDMHEAIYKVTRNLNTDKEAFQDSSEVRKLVAEIFSDSPVKSFTLKEKETELSRLLIFKL